MAGRSVTRTGGTKILTCTCKHAYQDKQYGPGRRVHNQAKCKATGRAEEYLCTVCGKRRGDDPASPLLGVSGKLKK